MARTRGSHHLPPYSILYSSPRRLHPNGTFSRDFQGGVLKLSWFGLPGLWASITPCSDLGLGRVLKQSCSSLWELFNTMSHSFCKRRIQIDSRVLVVGSQTASLTPDHSFAHNLGCRCPNGSCEAILDIYTSRPCQWYKEHPNARCFDSAIKLWIFESPGCFEHMDPFLWNILKFTKKMKWFGEHLIMKKYFWNKKNTTYPHDFFECFKHIKRFLKHG